MKLFNITIGKKHKKQINWMTVKCDMCSEKAIPYIMYVDRDEIRVRLTGYKGLLQPYVVCTKCGKTVTLTQRNMPKKIWNYVLQKAYESEEDLGL